MLARVPGPAEREATEATISAYGTGVTRETACTIGIVAWPPQVIIETLGASMCAAQVHRRADHRPEVRGREVDGLDAGLGVARGVGQVRGFAEVASKTICGQRVLAQQPVHALGRRGDALVAGPGEAVGLDDPDHVRDVDDGAALAAWPAGRCRCCPARRWRPSTFSGLMSGSVPSGVAFALGRRSTERNACVPPKSVLGRALTLLTAFRPGDAELTLAELARRTGLPKPTAHRMLAELAEWNVVERTPHGIRLGMRLFELGQLAPLQRGLREAAAPFLSDLFEATHETVHLAVPDGLDVVYVQKLPGRHGPRISSRVGGRMPAYCTGVGKAMLAFAPPERLAAVVAAGLARRTPRTVVAPGLLAEELARIRERGVAEEHEESTVGIACVAAPVLDGGPHAVAAISITGWANRLDTARLAPAVRTAALGLSRALRAGAAP